MSSQQIRILHCFRAPVGGLFRHVRDLAAAQSQLGHRVGLVCDARTGGDAAAKALTQLRDRYGIGIRRVPMSRGLGWRDIAATRAVTELIKRFKPQILHGHGAKGGAFARLAGQRAKRSGQRLAVIYTPHGGSLHYSPASLTGRLYLALEKRLAPKTDGMIFESAFSARQYQDKVMPPPGQSAVIYNGLLPSDFYQTATDTEAGEFIFVGELRHEKGVDVFLEALARLVYERPVRAAIVGAGPEAGKYKRLAKKLGLQDTVRFSPPVPARQAFARGRCLVVPSRAESFPYILLEAGAAAMPVIATRVGGIPEMYKGFEDALLPPNDVLRLLPEMTNFLDDPRPFLDRASALQATFAERFTVERMTRQILALYARCLG